MPLITPKMAGAIRRYKYKGGDLSFAYRFVLSPIAAWLVEFVPRSVMPNTLTLFGTALNFSTYFLMAHYRPLLGVPAEIAATSGDGPGGPKDVLWAWVCAWMGVGLLLYQTIDNMDGKQARRTGTSSALGLLFDHGCDALGLVAGVCSMAASGGMGATAMTLTMLSTMLTVFYFATWEEYYCGEMTLGYVNGPSDGLLILAAHHLAAAYWGQGFWDWEVPVPAPLADGLNALRGHALAFAGAVNPANGPAFAAAWWQPMGPTMVLARASLLFFAVSGGSTIVTNVFNVVAACRRQATDPHAPKHIGSGTKVTVVGAVFHGLFPWFGLLTLMWVLWGDIVPEGYAVAPRAFLWAFGFSFQRIVSRCMCAHLCEERYVPWKDFLVPVAVVAAHVACAHWFDDDSTVALTDVGSLGHLLGTGIRLSARSQALLCYELCAATGARYWYLVARLFNELREVLDINAFSPGPYKGSKKSKTKGA